MAHQRGDIIEVPFLIPHNNKTVHHPAVIISNQDVYDADECYIRVMLTTSTHLDQFTFEIRDEQLTKPNKQSYAQARCHLITYVLESHIVANSNRNRMKPNAVDRLVERINVVALSSAPHL